MINMNDFELIKNVIEKSKVPYVVAKEEGEICYIATEDVNSGAIIAFQFGIDNQLMDIYLADAVSSLEEFSTYEIEED